MNLRDDRPAVSVVMAVHNSAPYLRQALASIRWQSFKNWECICVDDGSTDETPTVLGDFAAIDQRFRILRQDKAGITAALTRGDAAARSNLIARMDSDDVALPDRLQRQHDYLQSHPGFVGVGAQVMLIDPSGSPIGPAPHAIEHEEIESRLLNARGGTIAHPTLMFRHDIADAVGGHRAEYEWAHDADLLVRLAARGRLANLPQMLLLYRQHPRNTCRTRHTEIRAQMLGLLKEAHAVRGTRIPVEVVAALTRPAKQTALSGKWARRAARNGYRQTAWRLYRQLLVASPLSFYTARVGVELVAHSMVSRIRGRRGLHLDVPDWRDYDASTGDIAEAA